MFIDLREKGEREGKEKETSMWEKHRLIASCTCPDWGSNPQPRYVPLLGSKLMQDSLKLHLYFSICLTSVFALDWMLYKDAIMSTLFNIEHPASNSGLASRWAAQ